MHFDGTPCKYVTILKLVAELVIHRHTDDNNNNNGNSITQFIARTCPPYLREQRTDMIIPSLPNTVGEKINILIVTKNTIKYAV